MENFPCFSKLPESFRRSVSRPAAAKQLAAAGAPWPLPVNDAPVNVWANISIYTKKLMKHKPCLEARVNVLNKIASRKSISYKKLYAKGLIPSHWKKHFATIFIIADYQKILKSLTLLSEYFRKGQQSAVHTSQNKNWLVSTISWNLGKIKREVF